MRPPTLKLTAVVERMRNHCRLAIVCAWHVPLSEDSNYSRGGSPLYARFLLEVLVSRKGGKGDLRPEGSETTKAGSNEQEFDTEASRFGGSKHIFVKPKE